MRRYDGRAWLIWVGVVALLALLTRNPLYLALLLLTTRLVAYSCQPRQGASFELPFWRIAGIILLFSTLFNMLLAHAGETVLARLPDGWWLIGGPLTLEAAIYGFISGLSLVTLLSAFLAFNAIVPSSELTRLVPPALHDVGLVLLVAITYVPETLRQWERIREAQLVRGHRMRRIMDWRPLLIPLLIGGLERSLDLAETMVSRGYGATGDVASGWTSRLLFLGGLLLAFGGAVALAWGLPTTGWTAILGGGGLIAAGYWFLARRVTVTRYRPSRWSVADTVVVSTAALSFLLVRAPEWILARETLSYSPYPVASWPPFDPLVGIALLLLTTPAILEIAS